MKNKCSFFHKWIGYLGLEIDKDGISTIKETVEAIVKTLEPNNLSELQAFLGIINYYYEKFILNSQVKGVIKVFELEANFSATYYFVYSLNVELSGHATTFDSDLKLGGQDVQQQPQFLNNQRRDNGDPLITLGDRLWARIICKDTHTEE